MEIAPVPRRRLWSSRAWMLLAVTVFAPVTMLAVLPTMLGLDRYVVSSDSMSGSRDGSIGRGSVAFERTLPVTDLEVGDVVTYRPPAQAGVTGLVTHRVVEQSGATLRTQGDANPAPDPWLVRMSDQPTMSRVVVHVPYVGYPFLAFQGQSTWVNLLMVAGAFLVLLLGRDTWRIRRARLRPGLAVSQVTQ